ncbi:MAG: hypothetical protein EPN36_04010 [Rhodanobacteraceae bacterium]|nr:MAG: hypothetical protein EPN36_04010 [Rhodanobacteraceae bacterium]
MLLVSAMQQASGLRCDALPWLVCRKFRADGQNAVLWRRSISVMQLGGARRTNSGKKMHIDGAVAESTPHHQRAQGF